MKSKIGGIIAVAFLAAGGYGAVLSDFHTSPSFWSKPRHFHTEATPDFKNRFQLRRVPLVNIPIQVNPSPNQAYYSFIQEKTLENGFPILTLSIYNERDYLIELKTEYYKNYKYECRWINEKLLFFRCWLGRTAGVDLIVDVEKEKIIDMEMVNDGVIPFQQFHPEKTDSSPKKSESKRQRALKK